MANSSSNTVSVLLNIGAAHPACGHAFAMPSVLTRQDHRLEPIHIEGVSDPDGDPVTIAVTGVTQDEPVVSHDSDENDDDATSVTIGETNGRTSLAADDGSGKADHHIGGHDHSEHQCPDAIIDKMGGVSVRAERLEHGNGRVYAISFTATDGRGGSCSGTVQVCVPVLRHGHHEEDHRTCVDDGQRFNSLGPCPPGEGDDDRPHHGHPADRKVAAQASLTGLGARAGNMATLEYSITAPSDVKLALFDIAGRRVATLVSGFQSAGAHQLSWNTASLARGMYFYRLQAAGIVLSKAVLVLK